MWTGSCPNPAVEPDPLISPSATAHASADCESAALIWFVRHPQHPTLYLRVSLSLRRGYSVAVRGEALPRSDETGEPFLLTLPTGEAQRIYVEAVPFDYAPVLRINGQEIPVAPPLPWWEKVFIVLPLAGALIVGALRAHNGLVPGLLGSLTAAILLRSGLSQLSRSAGVGVLALTATLLAAFWSVPASWAAYQRSHGIQSYPVWETLRELPAPPPPAQRPGVNPGRAGQPLTPAVVFHLRDLLLEGELDSLETLFAKWSAEAGRDVRNETPLYDAFDAFQSVGPEFEGALDRWIEERPGSWNARLARTNYLVRLAYRQRGAKSRSLTPRSKFAAMNRTLGAALLDLSAAIRLNPGAIEAYWLAIEAATSFGDTRGIALALERALQISPLSFFSRARALLALTPRWGGSYGFMESVAAADSLYRGNPELRQLSSFVPLDKGNVAWLERDTVLARRYLDQAMELGPTFWACFDRGRLLYKLDLNEAAVRDLDCAISLRPADADAHHYKSRALYDIAHSRYPDAWAELFGRAEAEGDLAFRLDSLDETIREYREFLTSVRSRSRR
jgi:tetratricopeptide (TPR) repeat protein